ncbi:MAG: hypothetical protein ABJA64_01735, partial [Candidatus Saccharibacteria bacterium]
MKNSRLTRIYGKSSDLGLERLTTATTSFCILAQYCLDHNPQLLTMLSVPKLFSSNSVLTLANNAIEQLELVSNLKTKTGNVFNLVNFCATPIGHRLLRQRLLCPITDPKEMETRWDMVDMFSDCFEKYLTRLKKIGDIEKLYRKIIVSQNLDGLKNFLASVTRILQVHAKLSDQFPLTGLQVFKDFLQERIDLTSDDLFISDDLKLLANKKTTYLDFFNQQKDQFERDVDGTVDMSMTETDCLYKFSNSKYRILASRLNIVSSNQTYKYCTTEKIKAKYLKYLEVVKQYDETFSTISQEFITNLVEFDKIIRKLVSFIGQVDVYCSSAKAALQYKYCRPTIVGRTTEQGEHVDITISKTTQESCIHAQGLRHPVIERLIDTIYTPHDVTFTADSPGMLLYGFNAAGKSSLMKTVGINLILAQAGLFCAADSFEFYPYTSIQTRILSGDNQQQGKSSYAVELTELRDIFSTANGSSLILGDEVSKGTETVSGVAIVAATVDLLVKKKSHFLFATHLHQLTEISQVSSLIENETVKVFHLKVIRNPVTNVLIYDRGLSPGSGDSLYGLEVARAMRLPQEFIDEALKIRLEITGKSLRPSRYNSEM